MPKSTENLNQDLEDLLVSKGYEVTSLDSSGKEVPVPAEADLLSFHFHRGGKDYGTVTATIDGLKKLTLYYDDSIADSGVNEDDMDADRGMNGTSWISLVKQLKKFAQRHQLGFVLKDTDRLRSDIKRRQHAEKLEESINVYSGIGFNVRSDILWPTTIFESTNSFQEFSNWLEEQRSIQIEPQKNAKCILAMVMPSDGVINLIYGFAVYIGQNQTHYILKNDTGVHEYSKKNQIVFNSKNEFGKFEMILNLKFGEGSESVITKQLPVMETYKMKKSEARAELKPKKKVAEGGIVKSIKRGMQGWGAGGESDAVSPKDVVQAFGKMDGQRLANFVASRKDFSKPRKNSARAFADKVIDREMKQRGYGRVADKGEQDMATNTQTKLDEGYYGNKKMSYSDDTPTVKMVIKHNKQIEETDQRFRHIEKIFLETSDGERFSVPTNKPSRARMFARHIAEGGEYKDERWSHITEICEDLDKLGGFVRATHNKREQFNESAQRMISEAVEQYQQLRETVKRLSGTKGYNKYFESYEPKVILEDDSDLSEAFMHSSIDTRIESALPVLSKFGIKMGKINESDMFSEWADSLVSEALDPDSPRQVEALVELLSDMIPVGPNAEVAIGELNDVIEDDELYNRLRRAAKADPDSDARPQIIAWMQEQDDEKYRQALDKIEADDSDSAEEQSQVKQDDASDSTEPDDVKPKKKQPEQPPAGNMGGMPPLPGASDGLPPMPPLPPLSEGDAALASFKRLLGR